MALSVSGAIVSGKAEERSLRFGRDDRPGSGGERLENFKFENLKFQMRRGAHDEKGVVVAT